MFRTAALAETAALVGDPARASMLMTLMDGRALTAGELARAARRQRGKKPVRRPVRA